MNKATCAALLSAFVCPGVGHLYLKKTAVGLGIFAVAAYALFILLSNAFDRALEISDKIISGAVDPDLSSIRELVTEQSEPQQVSIATAVLIIVWIIAIIDSYRAGRIADVGKPKTQKNSTIK